MTLTKIQPQLPPIGLMSDCVVPPFNYADAVNQDLVEYCLKLINEIHKCNADFDRLKAWRRANAHHDR